MTAEYQDSWHEAMALLAYPNTAPDALRLLAHLVDDIWHLAGDKSHDTSWSTKRASIAFIYKVNRHSLSYSIYVFTIGHVSLKTKLT